VRYRGKPPDTERHGANSPVSLPDTSVLGGRHGRAHTWPTAVPVDDPREEQRVPADEVVDLVSRLLARYHTAMEPYGDF
jgi:hypothetical protein